MEVDKDTLILCLYEFGSVAGLPILVDTTTR
jgi:hypothetical protein